MLNVDAMLKAMQDHTVECILIGGMNFLLNHQPILTYDVDLWVRSTPENLSALNLALQALGAQWGPTEASWKAVPLDPAWLFRQSIFCLTTAFGALDLFFDVKGLENRYEECRAAALPKRTQAGTPYFSLSDEHMLACQEALRVEDRKIQRMAVLQAAISQRRPS